MRDLTQRFGRVLAVVVLLLSLAFGLFRFDTATAAPDPNLTGGAPVTGTSNSQMPITDIQVTGTGNPTVPVKLRVASGTLSMTTTTGLTFTGGTTGSTLQFSGTLTNVNAALATLRYLRSGTGSDTLEVSLVNAGEVFFPDTNHIYEYVSYTGTWTQANANAQTRTKYGATGYLTTITSSAENNFVAARLADAGWMGASDAAIEGDWKWVTGPETGTSFWSGLWTGGTVSGRYANWSSNEPNDYQNGVPGEDCAQFLSGGSGQWNDLPCNSGTLPGYVVEYGSPSSPIEIASLNVSITTQAANIAPNSPTTLGPTALVNGSWGGDNTPTPTFSLSDNNGGDTLRYRIQIDDTANFSSPVVDYTSVAAAQGARNFTVGQSGGTYTVGTSNQTLPDGSYYWRVKALDPSNAESSYVTANSGSIAFRIDTATPTVPGTPQTDTPTADSTPSWTWTASTDDGSGLSVSQPYRIEWSQDADFNSFSGQYVTTNSFTHSSTLTDGLWYVRVSAKDAQSNTSATAGNSVLVDTTAPTTPGTPQVSTAASNNQPVLSWAGSTDIGSGLGITAYLIEWSNTSDFTTIVGSGNSANNSFTIPGTLPDGTWYYRVKTTDQAGNATSFASSIGYKVDTTVPRPATTLTAQRSSTIFATAPVTTTELPATQPDSSGSSILLNNYNEYSNDVGKQLNINTGQVVYFDHQTQRHSATVKQIGTDFVVVTIASTPRDVQVTVGQEVYYDVDEDGTNDIYILLRGVNNGVADLVFKQLVTSTPITATIRPTKQFNYWWLLPLILVALLISYLIRRKQKQ